MPCMRSGFAVMFGAGLILLAAWAPHARAQLPRPATQAAQAQTDATGADMKTTSASRNVRIGVLAYRGSRSARQRWAPLLRHLSASVPGVHFLLQPEWPFLVREGADRRMRAAA